MDRLVDKKLEGYLKVFGAVVIEGPKWCGKTWTLLHVAKSAIYLDDEDINIIPNSYINSVLDFEVDYEEQRR